MSISPFDEERGNEIIAGHPLSTQLNITKVDASYSTFIRDVYDARTPLECELALRQISIFWGGVGSGDADKKDVNPFINGYCDSNLVRNMTSRRFAIVFYPTDKFSGKQAEFDKVSDLNKSNNVIAKAVEFNEKTFAKDLTDAIKNITDNKKPAVFTRRNPTSESMSVSDWRFHGIALGMAKLDQRDGDNVCTLLRSGAQTIRNGPFKIMAGDPVGWVFPHELCCFDKEGKRKLRWTATVSKLRRLFAAGTKNARLAMLTNENPEVGPGGEYTPKTPCATAKIDHTGDGSKNTQLKLQVVPLRVSPGCCRVTDSIRDACERRVGTAISNAAGSAMVDLLVGSDL
jgi:hypothetical protein